MSTVEASRERLQLFVPEGDRASKTLPVDLHDRWVVRLMEVCGRSFGGATSYGRGAGVWVSRGRLYWDRVTVIEVWLDTTNRRHVARMSDLKRELDRMRRALRQKAVLIIIDGVMKCMRGGKRS